jgi:two-component system cell cycle sensor histidine kinase/response regulator CckA
VDSTPGRGTAFHVYLPRVDDAVPVPEYGLGSRPVAVGTETILLVEDEEDVRSLAREILTEHSDTVLEGKDGAHALAVNEAHGGPIHLLLTDVVMPYLNGLEAADRMHAANGLLRKVREMLDAQPPARRPRS